MLSCQAPFNLPDPFECRTVAVAPLGFPSLNENWNLTTNGHGFVNLPFDIYAENHNFWNLFKMPITKKSTPFLISDTVNHPFLSIFWGTFQSRWSYIQGSHVIHPSQTGWKPPKGPSILKNCAARMRGLRNVMPQISANSLKSKKGYTMGTPNLHF